MTQIGTYLRLARQHKGYTLRKTAQQVGISASYLSRLESGDEKCPPSEALLRRFSVELDVDLDGLCQLAGRVPADVLALLVAEPGRFATVRRMWTPHPHVPEATTGNIEEETEG